MSGERRHRIGPWATPILAAAEMSLVWSGVLTLRSAVLVGVVIEAALWLSALGRAWVGLGRYRRTRAAGVDAWRAAEDGLAALVPRRIAHVLLLEPTLLACLARWALRRHQCRNPTAFAYHRQIVPLLAGIIALVVVEGATVDTVLMLALPGSAWAWIVLGARVYGLVVLAGLYASFVTRPHLVTDDRLVLRDGVFHQIELPRSAVTAAWAERRANLGRSGFKTGVGDGTALLCLGDATVVVDLAPATTVLVDGSPLGKPPRRLAITADDPERLVRALRPQPAELAPPAPPGPDCRLGRGCRLAMAPDPPPCSPRRVTTLSVRSPRRGWSDR